MRRGEALGLKWSDIDFEDRSISLRRSITQAGISTPKSGKSRRVAMASGLAEAMFDLLTERRKEVMTRGLGEVPEWAFTTKTGNALHPRNAVRSWERVRRLAQKKGVRPLKLHCARHTWATRALEVGRSIRWVADQLGHADPSLTLKVYAHAMRASGTDLSFAEFGGPKRPYTAPAEGEVVAESRKSAKNGGPGAIRTRDPSFGE